VPGVVIVITVVFIVVDVNIEGEAVRKGEIIV
jgi:hypothetical protein